MATPKPRTMPEIQAAIEALCAKAHLGESYRAQFVELAFEAALTGRALGRRQEAARVKREAGT